MSTSVWTARSTSATTWQCGQRSSHPALRDRYGAVKRQLAGDPGMTIDRYVAGKSAVLRDILAVSDLTAEENDEIYERNTRHSG